MAIADLGNVFVRFGPDNVPLLELIDDWCARVVKINADRSASPNVTTTWGIYDLIGAYHLRTVIDREMPNYERRGNTPYFPAILHAGDELLRLCTYEESDSSVLNWLDRSGGKSGWWWCRVPIDGPTKVEYDEAREKYLGRLS